jgi:hypothetical protein
MTAAALAASPASGQPSKGKRAEAIFREGREAAAKGDMKTACAKFEESVSLARAPGPILNLADCEEKRGQLVSAAKRWAEGIELLGARDERMAFAKERAAALDKRLPRLRVSVEPGPASGSGAEIRVSIDGVEITAEEASKPLPVDPGEHAITAVAGEKTGRETIKIAEGESREVTLKLTEAKAPLPAPKEEGSPLRTAGYVAGGIGIVGLAVFGVTGGLMASHHGVVSDHCNANRECDAEGLAAVDSGKALGPINTAALIVGIAGVAAGVTLILLAPSPSAPSAALRAGVAPGGAWARIETAF